jgi:hypothetical protein
MQSGTAMSFTSERLPSNSGIIEGTADFWVLLTGSTWSLNFEMTSPIEQLLSLQAPGWNNLPFR